VKTACIVTSDRLETDADGKRVCELQCYRQTDSQSGELIFYSFGLTDSLSASADEVRQYRGQSALNWLEQSAVRLTRRR
jgi:hypothetical protein